MWPTGVNFTKQNGGTPAICWLHQNNLLSFLGDILKMWPPNKSCLSQFHLVSGWFPCFTMFHHVLASRSYQLHRWTIHDRSLIKGHHCRRGPALLPARCAAGFVPAQQLSVHGGDFAREDLDHVPQGNLWKLGNSGNRLEENLEDSWGLNFLTSHQPKWFQNGMSPKKLVSSWDLSNKRSWNTWEFDGTMGRQWEYHRGGREFHYDYMGFKHIWFKHQTFWIATNEPWMIWGEIMAI